MDLTPEQRDLTGAVASKVQELGWDGDVTPFVDRIVSIIEGLVAEDPKFVEFAQVIYDQASKWAIAAWSEQLVVNMDDSGWGQLSNRLERLIPSSD
jgi:hypothetical protein